MQTRIFAKLAFVSLALVCFLSGWGGEASNAQLDPAGVGSGGQSTMSTAPTGGTNRWHAAPMRPQMTGGTTTTPMGGAPARATGPDTNVWRFTDLQLKRAGRFG